MTKCRLTGGDVSDSSAAFFYPVKSEWVDEMVVVTNDISN